MIMTSLCVFWIWVIGLSAGVFLVSRTRSGRLFEMLYRPLILVGFSIAVLNGVRLYLGDVLTNGDSDVAILLHIYQTVLNPFVHTLIDLGGSWASRLVDLPLVDSQFHPAWRGNAASVAFALWEVMIEDLFLGSLFWFGASSAWLRITKIRHADGPYEP
jgi:hypothetical protein